MHRAPHPLILVVALMCAALMSAAPPASAHHSRAMFDMAKNVTYRGVVKEFRWENPHSHIVLSVNDGAAGSLVAVEASSISLMISQGWNHATFKPGDPITVVAHPGKSGSGMVLLFYAIKPDGTRLYRAQHRYPSEQDGAG